MRILVLYNEPVLPVDHPEAESEHEILYIVDEVTRELVEGGHEVGRLGVDRDPAALLAGVRAFEPDVVFNLFEGLGDHYATEAHAAGMLEWLGIPYTGSPYDTLCLARNKPRTKQILQAARLPTADFFVVHEVPMTECPLEWPVIVKPALQDASVGIDQGSIVTCQSAFRERVAMLLDTYGPPVLVEEFLAGREFNVSVIELPEPKALPVAEILFEEEGPDFWPILSYDAKWRPESRDYRATPGNYPADVSKALSRRLQTLALKAFRLLGCRDYARVEFRMRRSGRPCILEVNPNPDYGPTAALAAGMACVDVQHAQFTLHLVEAAHARRGIPPQGAGQTTIATKPTETVRSR